MHFSQLAPPIGRKPGLHTEMQHFRDLENNTIFFATRNSDRRSEQSPARRTKPGPTKPGSPNKARVRRSEFGWQKIRYFFAHQKLDTAMAQKILRPRS